MSLRLVSGGMSNSPHFNGLPTTLGGCAMKRKAAVTAIVFAAAILFFAVGVIVAQAAGNDPAADQVTLMNKPDSKGDKMIHDAVKMIQEGMLNNDEQLIRQGKSQMRQGIWIKKGLSPNYPYGTYKARKDD